MKALFKTAFLLLLCLVFGGLATLYWYQITYFPDTDNAYVKAKITHIAPNISGPVAKVYVKDNQKVTKGTLLYQIDKRPFQIALKKAYAELALAEQNNQADFEAMQSAKAVIVESEAKFTLSKQNYHRLKSLVKQGRASLSEGDKALSEYLSAKANRQKAYSQFSQALVKVGGAHDENAAIAQAKINIEQAKLNLSYTEIKAPTDGYVTHFSVNPGDMANSTISNISIINPQTIWLEANFKETQMKNIKVGQSAKIVLDMYPDDTLIGKVDSISQSTGQTFALIPQENAGGNWVKVTQRIPIKITLNEIPKSPQLRVGASATVEINTRT